MNRNTYLSFQEALEYRYCASHDEIEELLSNIPELEIEKNWKNRGKNLLLNIDLALYFGIPFEDIVNKPNFLNYPTKINFAKYKLALLANLNVENFGIDINYLNSYSCIDDITKNMNAILAGALPPGYDIFKDISEASSDLNMDIHTFSTKFGVSNSVSFINKQFKTYYPNFYNELMKEFPEFNVQVPSQNSPDTTQTISTYKDITFIEPVEDMAKIRRRELKSKIKKLYNQPSKIKRGKLKLSTTNLDDFCYSTDKKFHHETKQKIKEKQKLDEISSTSDEQCLN